MRDKRPDPWQELYFCSRAGSCATPGCRFVGRALHSGIFDADVAVDLTGEDEHQTSWQPFSGTMFRMMDEEWSTWGGAHDSTSKICDGDDAVPWQHQIVLNGQRLDFEVQHQREQLQACRDVAASWRVIVADEEGNDTMVAMIDDYLLDCTTAMTQKEPW